MDARPGPGESGCGPNPRTNHPMRGYPSSRISFNLVNPWTHHLLSGVQQEERRQLHPGLRSKQDDKFMGEVETAGLPYQYQSHLPASTWMHDRGANTLPGSSREAAEAASCAAFLTRRRATRAGG